MSDKVIEMTTQLKGTVDDGTREIPIENKFGKLICNIYIRPSDISILDRYENVIKALPEVVKPLEELSIKNDGTAKIDDDWAVLKRVEKDLYRQLNYLFDMEEAEQIFAKRNPFSSVGGRFFCEIVIEAIGNIIESAVESEVEKTQKRTEKYLNDLNNG